MSRLFSVAVFAVIVVALAANRAQGTGRVPCDPELRPSADAKFNTWVQTAIVDHKKRGRGFSGAAFAQAAIVGDGKDLPEKRAELKEIYDRLGALSEDQRKRVFAKVAEVAGTIGGQSPTDTVFLHAIQFSGNSVGWAVDWNGRLERTTDGGLNWASIRVARPGVVQRLNPHLGIFRNMHFADEHFGLIVGLSSVFRSSDGGLTWLSSLPPSAAHWLKAVFCDPTRTCWVAGNEPNAIYQRPADLYTWSRRSSPAKGVITAIQFIGSTGWAISSLGEIIETTNGGQNWSELFRDQNKTLTALHFVDSQHGWVVGNRGAIMRTQDGGRTWVEQKIPTPPGFPIDELRLEAVNFADVDHGWAAGLHGMIFGTTDGGECWRIQRFEGLRANWLTIYALAITDGPTVWAAGNSGNIFVSTDGGAFWFPVHGLAVDAIRELKRAMDSLAKR